MLDLRVAQSALGTTAVEGELTAIDDMTAHTGDSLKGLVIKSANAQYVRAQTAGMGRDSVYNTGDVVASIRPNLGMHFLENPEPLRSSDIIHVYGLQDSGSSETPAAAVLVQRAPIHKLNGDTPKVHHTFRTTLAAQVANTWVSNTNHFSGVRKLEAGKKYGITKVWCYSTDALFFRFSGLDFGSFKPGGVSTTDIAKPAYHFDENGADDIPIFDGGNSVTVETFGTGTATPIFVVEVVEI